MILSPRLMKTVTMGIRTLRRKETLAETVVPIRGDFFLQFDPPKIISFIQIPLCLLALRENLGSLHEFLGSLQLTVHRIFLGQ